MLWILATLILACGMFIFVDWRIQSNSHHVLLQNGIDTDATVVSLRLYDGGDNRVPGRYVDDPRQASDLKLTVEYRANGHLYIENMDTTFSDSRNDHMTVYHEAQSGRLMVRYLKTNPAEVRPTAEFTDPKDNPYFGGR